MTNDKALIAQMAESASDVTDPFLLLTLLTNAYDLGAAEGRRAQQADAVAKLKETSHAG